MNPNVISEVLKQNHKRYSLVGVLALLAALTPVMLLTYSTPDITTFVILGWSVCLAAYVVASVLAGPIERGLWAGYLSFALTVAWLISGLGGAVAIIVIGSVVAAFIRYRLAGVYLVLPKDDTPKFIAAAERIAIGGAGIVGAAGVYALFGGVVPLNSENIQLIALFLALLVGLALTQAVGYLLIMPEAAALPPLWSGRGWSRLLAQIILIALAIMASLVFASEDLGFPGFALLMMGVLLQAIRYNQINQAQSALQDRIRELTLLNNIAQNVSSNLLMRNVLQNTYEWISEQSPTPLFYVGLLDSQRDVVEFPLVVVEGKAVEWQPRALVADAFISKIIQSDTIQEIKRGCARFDSVFQSMPDDENHQVALGIPLMVNDKHIGLMTIVNGTTDSPDHRTLETVANHVSLAIRNASLYDHTLQLAENLAEMNRSVQDVMFNLDADEAMVAACKTAMNIVRAQKAAIFLMEVGDNRRLRLAQHVGLSEAHVQRYQDKGLLLEPYGQQHIVSNLGRSDHSEMLKQLGVDAHFDAFAELPLRSGNAVIGKLVVFHERPHHYDRTELEMLEALAHQVTAALDNAELLGALEVYASEQAQLVHLSNISTSSLDVKTVAHRVASMMRQMVGIDRVWIGLVKPGNADMQLYGHDDAEEQVLSIGDLPELASMNHQDQSTAHVFYRTEKAPSAALVELMDKHGDQMVAIIPMIVNNEVMGMIVLANSEVQQFSDSKWRFIEMASSQITTQLQNAQLYQETQAALNRRLQQLGLIEAIAQQISRSLNQDVLIRNVLEAAIRATQAEVASIGLITDDGRFYFLELEVVNGTLREQEIRADEPEGLMARVLQSQQTLVVPDNSIWPDYIVSGSNQQYQSSVVAPLITEAGTIGALNVESSQLDFFNEERVEFIKNLAGHTSISIQNARLLQERQTQIETLTWLRDLSLGLSSTVEPESAYVVILQVALGLVQGQNAILSTYHPQMERLDELANLSLVDGIYVSDRVPVPMSIGLEAAASGEIQVIHDVTSHPAFAGDEPPGYGSLIVTPIKRSGVVHEIMYVTTKQARANLESEKSKIELLAYQVSGHLENLDLYDQIRSNSNRMRAILDSTRDSILLLDQQGQLIDGNVSAESLLNFTLEDSVGEDFAQMLHNLGQSASQQDLADKGLEALARKLRLNPQNISRHAFQLRSDGQIRHIEEVESPVLDSKNNVIGRLLTFRDVTEEILLNEYREEVLHMLVHDLREPLSSIIGSVHFLQDVLSSEGEADATVMQLLNVSLSSANNLYALVETILDIYKLENRRMPLNRTVVSIADIVDATISKFSANIRDAGVTVTQDIPPNTPAVNVDADIIHRVMTNLLGNAIRFTPAGGEIRFIATPDEAKRVVTVRVVDTGPGIPPNEVERIFEKFRQVEGSVPQRGHKGSGVGLSFCKTAIEAHNQKIWVEQDGPLSGACFAFTLPCATLVTV